MTTASIDELLEQDIDDLTSMAVGLSPDARNALLVAAAQALTRPDRRYRLKLIAFVQALAAAPDRCLNDSAVKAGAASLMIEAHTENATERLGALSALAVLVSCARELNAPLTHSILATFERGRIDSWSEIRDFANEVLSTGNPVFRQLISSDIPVAR